ncbi:hypothetical protein MTO96_021533 [Rhipicephalus appendiculatus]
MEGPPANMLVRLRPSAAECCLAEQISATGRPREVGTLDITNCLRLESHRVTRNTYRCMQLRYLRCIACRLEARDLLELMTSVQHLEELELSLVSEADALTPELLAHNVASELAHPTIVYVLRRLYAEIAYDGNFYHLSALLSLCHYVKHVHVHLVHGCSRHAVRRCRDIIEKLGDLESFTFTSELPSCRPLEPQQCRRA